MTSVLVVEDERKLREALVSALTAAGHTPVAASGVVEAAAALEHDSVDCILLDIRLRDGDGLALLRQLRDGERRDIPVIMTTAYGDSERTIQAMRDGAFDYVTKPYDLDRLLATVARAITQRELARATPAAPSPVSAGPLVGTSEAMLGVWKVIGRAAASDVPVLITGETGTGKELVARAIHSYSARANEPFVAVNLAALTPTLIESELMGHEKGAFTGALERHQGRIELARAGTLLLDEIGDLDIGLQTKLLRVLQDGTYERVGGEQTFQSKARILAATNKPVRPGLEGAALREDLYYRLAVIEIEVPPLRARRSDVPVLVAHALQGTAARAVTEPAMTRLMAYHWPGNVRELVHVVSRAAVLCGGDVIDVTDLPAQVAAVAAAAHDDSPREATTLKEALAIVERRMIVTALEQANGNRSEAARRLGIGRPQLYAKIEEYDIEREPR